MRRRRVLAAGLEQAVREARHVRRGRSAAVPVHAPAILRAEPVLFELADALRDRRLELPGDMVAEVSLVLTSAESPLHAPADDGELRRWACAVVARAATARSARAVRRTP